jgi:hypothetical protein
MQNVADITDRVKEKHAEADWALVWAKLSQMRFDSLEKSYRYAYDAGRGAQQLQETASQYHRKEKA